MMNDFIISFSTYIGENICKKILYLQFFLTVSLSDDKKACINIFKGLPSYVIKHGEVKCTYPYIHFCMKARLADIRSAGEHEFVYSLTKDSKAWLGKLSKIMLIVSKSSDQMSMGS